MYLCIYLSVCLCLSIYLSIRFSASDAFECDKISTQTHKNIPCDAAFCQNSVIIIIISVIVVINFNINLFLRFSNVSFEKPDGELSIGAAWQKLMCNYHLSCGFTTVSICNTRRRHCISVRNETQRWLFISITFLNQNLSHYHNRRHQGRKDPKI